MSTHRHRLPTNDRWARKWWGFGIGLCLLLWVDLATTFLAVSIHGLEAEGNPIMRALLSVGVLETVIVTTVVMGVALLGFVLIVSIGESLPAPQRTRYETLCSWWIYSLVFAGVLICVNNTIVILVGLTP